MIFATSERGAEGAQQFVNLRFVSSDEGPTITGVEFCAPRFEPFGCVGRRIDADGNEANIATDLVAEFFLHASESCAERRTDRRAGREDEIDHDCLTFDEIRVEMKLASVLIEHLDI